MVRGFREQPPHRGGNIGGGSQREDVARRDTVKQRQPVAAHLLQLIDRVLDAGVEELDADVGVVPDRRGARCVVVEEFHRYVGGIQIFEIREPEFEKILLADEADDVIENQDAVDRRDRLPLQFVPLHEEIGDDAQQTEHGLRLGLEGDQEFGCTHQERCDIEGAA